MTASVDEEALAEPSSSEARAQRGMYFTPRPVVDLVLSRCAPFVRDRGPLAVVDPACGAGAFLAAATERWPRAKLVGLELDSSSAERCRERVAKASVVVGDALYGEALEAALAALPAESFEVWVGNPPYNGTSPLLRSPEGWATACAWLPTSSILPRGGSLREDYVFFLLRASLRLARRPGVLAFVTSATLLDSFLYASVRSALLERLALREVIDLGPGVFRGTRVKTCVTVWTSPGPTLEPVRFERRGSATESVFVPTAPDYRLRADDARAIAMEQELRETGEALSTLVPISFPGLKTRFDELLVDDDAGRLFARVAAFLRSPPEELESFAAKHALPPRTWPKLRALKEASTGLTPSKACVRRFLRYRGPLPMGEPSWCYLHRRLIPRGDHRLRGGYDPHLEPTKLVFNLHELPLAARVLDSPGCVTAYRHSRFAPLRTPRRLLAEGLGVAARLGPGELADLTPNLSARGLALAARLGDPALAFEAIAAFLQSEALQQVWAPAFGTSREPAVPVESLRLGARAEA
jgi:SAM-dependent methyltransferase